MGVWESLLGTLRVEVTSAAVAGMLAAVRNSGILLRDVNYIDELTVQADIGRNDCKHLIRLVEKRGDHCRILSKKGIFWNVQRFRDRPILLAGCFLIIFLVFYLPTRVLFVQVEGNANVSTQQILEKAEQCGIYFGAARREVRSEEMKNRLLLAIPELKWAGINTYGCTAGITVNERTPQSTVNMEKSVKSIVASRDGIIQKITVLRGNPLCKVGQAVSAGQLLVSGYTDCGLAILSQEAEAEVVALTARELEAILPCATEQISCSDGVKKKYSLLIGKKLIKFYKDSGNSVAGCGKLYKKIPLMLPGGFQLPVALLIEETAQYKTGNLCKMDRSRVSDLAQRYLKSQMLAGTIEREQMQIQAEGDACLLKANYFCSEIIGIAIEEENLPEYEQ